MTKVRCIRVRGQVQGLGFRSLVWQSATRMGLSGDALNDGDGVLIRVAQVYRGDLQCQAAALSPWL
ncbi:MAG: acylphosphatase [Rhizobiaceae bacterium]